MIEGGGVVVVQSPLLRLSTPHGDSVMEGGGGGGGTKPIAPSQYATRGQCDGGGGGVVQSPLLRLRKPHGDSVMEAGGGVVQSPLLRLSSPHGDSVMEGGGGGDTKPIAPSQYTTRGQRDGGGGRGGWYKAHCSVSAVRHTGTVSWGGGGGVVVGQSPLLRLSTPHGDSVMDCCHLFVG